MEVYDVNEEDNRRSTCFNALGTTMMTSSGDQRVVWEQNLIQEMNDTSMFCNDDHFPQLPDFPCMSSSSSSSSNPAPAKPISSAAETSTASSMSSSTSSAASWAVLKEEGDGADHGHDGDDRLEIMVNRKKISDGIIPVGSPTTVEIGIPTVETTDGDGSGTIDCMEVMENYGYMDLIDGNEIWDPSSLFEQNPPDLQPESEVVQESDMKTAVGDGGGGGCGGGGRLDELGTMFFEWLKSNKEFISAEDMRNIKIKKSTVECASKRLGSSKEGQKQLLKLILEWVQRHQLQRKNNSGAGAGDTSGDLPASTLYPPPPPPPLPFNSDSWVPPDSISNGFYPPYMADQGGNGMVVMAAPPVQPPSTFSYIGGDYTGAGDYQVLEPAPSWNPSAITMAASYNNQFPLASGYPEQFSYNLAAVYAAGGGSGGDSQQVMRLGQSATKEARKKRMARQRRTYFHHHHHSRQNQSNHHHHVAANSDHHPHAMLVDDNCSGGSHGGTWLYWPSPPSTSTVPPPHMEAPHRPSSRPLQSSDRQLKQASSDKLPGLNTEKNLKFLLQKVLKQSDVGSLGRIVMPKKEAESHLPDIDSRDGITIAMEDIGTSQVWNMRYRFWPNNKSRMYLLENTGDFVKANGLQEGDFIVLYSNVKCGKYLIRGVKVRQPASGKSEGKKSVKRSHRSTS